MASMQTRITQGGRLVLPAAIRKEMEIEDGETVLLHIEGGVLQVVPLKSRLAAVQAACSKVLAGGVVDEFIEERRKESAREME